jgi:hypothetical protein
VAPTTHLPHFTHSVASATDILLFRHWHDLAGKKRRQDQKQIPTTIFFKKILFHLQIYIMLNTTSVCEILYLMPYYLFFTI